MTNLEAIQTAKALRLLTPGTAYTAAEIVQLVEEDEAETLRTIEAEADFIRRYGPNIL